MSQQGTPATGAGIQERLERRLTDLFQSAPAAVRVLKHAAVEGIELSETTGVSAQAWFEAVDRADKQGKLPNLVAAALRDFPSDDQLNELDQELRGLPTIGPSIREALTALHVHCRQLRRRGHYSEDRIEDLDTALARLDDLVEHAAMTSSASRKYTPAGVGVRLRSSISAMQLYAELLQSATAPTPRRPPGVAKVPRPLQEVAADRFTLIEAKEQLQEAVADLLVLYDRDTL